MEDDKSGRLRFESRDGSTNRRGARETAYDGGHRERDVKERKLESIFRALTSQRRRYVLYELQDEGVSDLDSLATGVAAAQRGVPPDEVDDDAVERTKLQLVHEDIPQLEDAGFVEYDHRSRAVRYSDQPELLDAILHLCAYVDDPAIGSR